MKSILFLAMFLASIAKAELRVAIIDTGLNPKDPRFSELLCKDATPWDFVVDKPLEDDLHGHGTHVAGLIKDYAGDTKYCLLVYRYYDNSGWGYNNLSNELRAIKQAIKDRADIVNFSGGGNEPSKEECEVIKSAPKTTFVCAAGNDDKSIDPPSGYYPASCKSPNVVPVGAKRTDCKEKASSSNFGTSVKAWELGVGVISTLPLGHTGMMSGTSQATAIHTGKIIAGKEKEGCTPQKPSRTLTSLHRGPALLPVDSVEIKYP